MAVTSEETLGTQEIIHALKVRAIQESWVIGVLTEFKTKPYRSKRISDYCQRMSRASEGNVVDAIVATVLLQQGFRWEENTSSKYEPQALYDALALYAPSENRRVDVLNDLHWKRAFRATFKIYAKPKNYQHLQPLTTPTEIATAVKMEKSSGLPFMTDKADDFWYALNRAEQVKLDRKVPSPCVAYKRTQLGGKTRLVWGYPFEMTILEAQFAKGLIDVFLRRHATMAFGMTTAEVGALVLRIDNSYGQTYGLDFSKFDSSVSSDLIHAAFNILETWYTNEDRERLAWDKVVDFFIHTPIVMPNGKLYTGKNHGVPSGSFFTQLIDSIVNTMVQFYLASKFQYSLSWEDFLVLGDDVIISIPKEISLTELAQEVSTFGMRLHSEEGKSKKYAHFLGATWIKGIPYRPHEEILQKMVYPETYRVYPSKDTESRWLLAVQLIMQYCSAYANAVDFLPGNMNPGRWDEAPVMFKEAYSVKWVDWPEWQVPDIAKFKVGLYNGKTHSLGSRLMG